MYKGKGMGEVGLAGVNAKGLKLHILVAVVPGVWWLGVNARTG